MCKHLVQAVGRPDAHLWHEVKRRRVMPLYQHPLLVQKGNDGNLLTRPEYIDPQDGAITNGEDYIMSGDKEMLCGSGGWHDIDADSTIPGKRGWICESVRPSNRTKHA